MSLSACSSIHSCATRSRRIGSATFRSFASATSLRTATSSVADEREAERAALVQQRRHRDLPAVADLAEQVLLRHLHVGEEDLVELRLAGDLHERPHLDARRVHVDDHVGEVLRSAARPGSPSADEDAVVGDVRERRPDLLAVDEEVVALVLDARPHGGEVGAGARLGEALAPDLLGREDLREVALLLLLASRAR